MCSLLMIRREGTEKFDRKVIRLSGIPASRSWLLLISLVLLLLCCRFAGDIPKDTMQRRWNGDEFIMDVIKLYFRKLTGIKGSKWVEKEEQSERKEDQVQHTNQFRNAATLCPSRLLLM